MTALEIILLLIGIICVAGSFILMNKIDGTESGGAVVNTALSDRQKEDIKNQIVQVFDDQMETYTSDITERTEIALEKLSNQKIGELSEYSETVLNEINRNHTEVMFLYDMLIEKNKEVNNTVKALNEVAAQFNANDRLTMEKAEAPIVEKQPEKPVVAVDVDEVKDYFSAATEASNDADEDLEQQDDIEFLTGANKNKAILDLYEAGESDVDIAKDLGLGIGEVKLVIDLFKGQR